MSIAKHGDASARLEPGCKAFQSGARNLGSPGPAHRIAPMTAPFTIALTGGIASGKSAVSERLAALGTRVLDADVLARELVMPGTPALAIPLLVENRRHYDWVDRVLVVDAPRDLQ